MRKFYDLCRTSAMHVLFLGVCLSVVCCSKDEDSETIEQNVGIGSDGNADGSGSANSNAGSGNTTDMAVTGGVTDITTWGATIKGYVNVDQTLAMLIQDFGVEYSVYEGLSPNYSYHAEVQGYTGREFSVSLRDLKPNTTYYYRTYIHQMSGMYQYGETLSFTTKDVYWEVGDISYTRATISYPYPGLTFEVSNLYCSTSSDGPFTKYEYKDDWNGKVDDKIYYGRCTIEGLQPNTTYYCYLQSSSYNRSPVVSFTTKDFDVSGFNVTYEYKPEYDSYKDRYGRTVDLKWLSGTYTVKITSSAGNQYKYGVEGEYTATSYRNFVFYSTDTSSPYTIEATIGYYNRVEELLDIIHSWEASDDEYDLLEALLKEELEVRGGLYADPYPNLYPFVEIDGERIYISEFFNAE